MREAAIDRKDVYQRVTDQIVADLEQGTRPWLKPWSASHMEGRVVLPRRCNGIAYRGVNIIALGDALQRTAPAADHL